MPRPCPMDLRERVVAAFEGGPSRQAVARVFQVVAATLVRWVQIIVRLERARLG